MYFRVKFPLAKNMCQDSDLDENSDSEQVGNSDWCECEDSVSLSERECICWNEWNILEEN